TPSAAAATPSAPRDGLCGPNPIWYGFRGPPRPGSSPPTNEPYYRQRAVTALPRVPQPNPASHPPCPTVPLPPRPPARILPVL
ncbi:unnamed protein product, partial [Ixodes hexagonus]